MMVPDIPREMMNFVTSMSKSHIADPWPYVELIRINMHLVGVLLSFPYVTTSTLSCILHDDVIIMGHSGDSAVPMKEYLGLSVKKQSIIII